MRALPPFRAGLRLSTLTWLAALGSCPLAAQTSIPYPKVPSWQSVTGGYSTGGIFVDLDRDGRPDYVSADGNDMARQTLRVWYNRGGTFASAPDWSSKNADYHGHLDAGDVNGDGWPDVVVSIYLGPNRFASKGWVELYLNDGKGKLGTLPAWRSQDSFFSFSCALGDMDGDGDLDLAVATGEAYRNPKDKDRIYANTGGTFSRLPVWTSGVLTHSMDVAWCDVDGDGDLDLAFAGARGGNTLYLNAGGRFPSLPSWTSTDGGTRHNGNSLCFGDADGDGLPDLAVSDNRQLGGRGTFRIYRNLGKGRFTATPWWESNYFYNGYVSGLVFVDFDRDGDLDLAGGGWWAPTAIWVNTGRGFAKAPSWRTTGTSVVEAIFSSDVNGDGLRRVKGENHAVAGGRRVLRLKHSPLVSLDKVTADGVALAPSAYAFHAASGTLSLKTWPSRSLSVDYTYTDAPDLGVTNWDTSRGNYCFLRTPPFRITVHGPATTLFKPGSAVLWTEDLAVTVARPQFLVYTASLDFPRAQGTWRILAVPIVLPGPLALNGLRWGIPIPKPLAANLFGAYRYRAELFDAGAVKVSAGSFTFTIVP